jgi:hypothetical protein
MFLIKIAEELKKANVPYAIVGGYAVALHGAVRGTVDVDLVIQLSEESFCKTEAVLLSLGMESRLPVSGRQVFQFRKEYIRNRNLIAWSFFHPKRPQDSLDVIVTQDLGRMKIETRVLSGVEVKIASIESLIEMKSGTGRPQDQSDVEALRKILARKSE